MTGELWEILCSNHFPRKNKVIINWQNSISLADTKIYPQININIHGIYVCNVHTICRSHQPIRPRQGNRKIGLNCEKYIGSCVSCHVHFVHNQVAKCRKADEHSQGSQCVYTKLHLQRQYDQNALKYSLECTVQARKRTKIKQLSPDPSMGHHERSHKCAMFYHCATPLPPGSTVILINV